MIQVLLKDLVVWNSCVLQNRTVVKHEEASSGSAYRVDEGG